MKLYEPISGILGRKGCEGFSVAPTAPVFETILRTSFSGSYPGMRSWLNNSKTTLRDTFRHDEASGSKTKLREAAGFALVIAGLFGLLLPLIPGVPLLLAGVAVLGPNHPRIQPWIARLERLRCSLRGRKTGEARYPIAASRLADEKH